jgi:hypothetical protein
MLEFGGMLTERKIARGKPLPRQAPWEGGFWAAPSTRDRVAETGGNTGLNGHYQIIAFGAGGKRAPKDPSQIINR